MREANISLSESAEASLKVFDMSLKNLQSEYNNFVDISVKATIQILCNVRLFNKSDKRDELLKMIDI